MMKFDINRSVFEALDNIAPIQTSKVSMYAIDDSYAHPPFLRFRFKGVLKHDPIYNHIKLVIENFKGNLEWSLITKPESQNYIIILSFFVDSLTLGNFYKKDFYVSKLGNDLYNELIDKSIEDIPNLSIAISSCQLDK